MSAVDPLEGVSGDHLVEAGLGFPGFGVRRGDWLLVREVTEKGVHGRVAGVIRRVPDGELVVAAVDGEYVLRAGGDV